jgi:hypothetical protein
MLSLRHNPSKYRVAELKSLSENESRPIDPIVLLIIFAVRTGQVMEHTLNGVLTVIRANQWRRLTLQSGPSYQQ